MIEPAPEGPSPEGPHFGVAFINGAAFLDGLGAGSREGGGTTRGPGAAASKGGGGGQDDFA